MIYNKLIFIVTVAIIIIVLLISSANRQGGKERVLRANPGSYNQPVSSETALANKAGSIQDYSDISHAYRQATQPEDHSLPKHLPALNSNNGIAKEMQAMLNGLDGNIQLAVLDDLANRFINDTSLSRREKLDFLWNYANSPNAFRSAVAMELLRYFKPIELTDKIISGFDQWNNSEKRAMACNILMECGYIDRPPEELSAGELDLFYANAPKILDFFKKIIRNSSYPEDVVFKALSSYVQIASSDEAIAILGEVTADMWERPATYQAEMLQLWTDAAMSNDTAKRELLPSIIESASFLDEEGKAIFNPYLYSSIKDFALPSETKSELERYIYDNKPKPDDDARYFHWLEAYARVKQTADNDWQDIFIKTMLQEDDPKNIASALIFSDDALLSKLSSEQVDTLRTVIKQHGLAVKVSGKEFFDASLEALNGIRQEPHKM